MVHDELDLPFGDAAAQARGRRRRPQRPAVAHRSLGTREYLRVRVGIGRPPGRQDPADFVLRDFSSAERKELDFVVSDAADAVRSVVADGWERAQAQVNTSRNARHA